MSQGRQTISEENQECQGEGCDAKVAGRGLPVVMGVFLDNRSSEPVLKDKHEFGRKIRRRRGIWAGLPAWAKVHSLHPGIPRLPSTYHVPGPWGAKGHRVCSGLRKKFRGWNGGSIARGRGTSKGKHWESPD